MTPLRKGLILALVQVLLITAVGAKLLVDRARYPKVWVETAPYDPDSPFRGRYVRFQALLEAEEGAFPNRDYVFERGRLEVKGDRLVAVPADSGSVDITYRPCGFSTVVKPCLTLSEPLAFFIPEDIPDPSIRQSGEELWAQVTLPPYGAPRPIQLGVKKDGKLTPLDI